MEKLLKSLLLVLFTLTLSMGMTACGGDDDKDEPDPATPETTVDPLVGTWIEKNVTRMPFTLVLRADNTGSLSYDTNARMIVTDYFNWSKTESGGSTYLNMINTSGDVIIRSVVNRYVLAGDELILVLDWYDTDGTTVTSYQANFKRR